MASRYRRRRRSAAIARRCWPTARASTIDTPALDGSIALKGGRLDDLSLKDYRETPDKNSPNIVLLTPAGAPSAYYAESGFVAQAGADVPLPGPGTLVDGRGPASS